MSDELILEKAASPALIVDIKNASSFFDIAAIFADIFDIPADQIPGQSPPKTPTDYKAGNTDFGLQARGVKAREQLNATARDILSRMDSLDDLSEEDIAVLKQYSGRGGTSVNSQFEYYTPTPVASGVWDILKEHGFTTGNVLDPATGAGVFSATKPEGTIVTGTDIDPTGSKIASLLHPEDSISNQSFESLSVKTPDDHFDSVVGNVPFGDARGKSIHDDPAYKDEKRLERYFILRALDKTKAGGLACLVVPTNIVGAKSERWRRFRIALSKKAEFLGAHKLPSKTFSGQGTDTVTDIIVLKKHPRDLLERIEDLSFDSLKETNVVWETFVDGRYWLEDGRPFIQGKWVPKIDGDRWSREVVDGDIDPMAIKTKLAIKFQSRIDWDALESAPANVPSYVDGDQKMINGRQYELTSGQWVPVVETMTTTAIDKALYGVGSMEELKAILASAGGPLQLTFAQMVAVYEAWPDLLMSLHRDAIIFTLKQDESIQEQAYRGTIVGGLMGRLSSGAESDYDRPRLQQLVVGEIDRFGHPKNNKDLQFAGSCSRAFGLFVNAVDEKGTFCDLLSGTLNTDHLQFNPSDIQSIVEHLYIREGIHSIELEDVKKLYAGTMKIDSLGDLADVDNIAITPAGRIEPLSRYTAGDVYPKIVAMTEAMADEQDDRLKSKWQHQIAIIKSRLHFTKSEDITVGFRDKWLPRSYVLDFLKENGYKNAKYGKWQKVMVEDPVSGNPVERLRFIEDLDAIDGQFKDVENKSGFSKQFEKYLNGGQITSSKQEYIEAYKAEAKALTEAFNAWLQQHSDLDRITKLYNRKFNSFIPLEYEDAPLKIDDLDDEIELHGYQCQSVRKLSEEGTGFLSDDVGLGKTFSALALHFYNKQMGRTKKTCISVPDSVLDNWYHEADAITKNMDDCLFVGLEPKLDKDGNIQREAVLDEHGNQKIGRNGQPLTRAVLVRRKSKQDIWEAMWQIPTTSKSLVVMTKENFGKIPMRRETKGKYAEKMAERELISSKIAKSMGAGTKQKERSYQDDKDALRAEAKYSDEGTVKKDEFPYFEDMGFTNLVVDECFIYDTEVETRHGHRKIGEIVENKLHVEVRSFDTECQAYVWRPVVRWYKNRRLTRLIQVVHTLGSFICTENHKIWTLEEGYVEAKVLQVHHSLMPRVWNEIRNEGQRQVHSPLLQPVMPPTIQASKGPPGKSVQELRDRIPIQIQGAGNGEEKTTPVLFNPLQCPMANESAWCQGGFRGHDSALLGVSQRPAIPANICPDEKRQSDEEKERPEENEKIFKGPNILVAGRQRKIDPAAKNVSFEDRASGRISDSNRASKGHVPIATTLLQGRPCNPFEKNCNRDRRQITSLEELEILGSPQNRSVECPRVVGVTILERGDFERYGLGDSDHRTVYDIEVSGTHNYFADGVLVSNCHEFKNLYQAGKESSKIAYLPTAPSSQRALDMAMKTAYLREVNDGKGVYPLTATPVSNSPFEIMNMLSYVAPMEEFERFGVFTVDDFVRVFGKIEQVDKVMVSGEVTTKDGLVGFQNLDGLRNLFHKYVLFRDAKDVGLKLPPHDEINQDVELSEEQELTYQDLREQAIEAAKPGKKEDGDTHMFQVIRDMDRVTTDMDLYHHTITFIFKLSDKEKVDKLVAELPKTIEVVGIDEDGRSLKVKQSLTPVLTTKGKVYEMVINEAGEEYVASKMQRLGIEENDVSHPLTPKYAKLVENIRAHLEEGGKQIVFTEEKSQHRKLKRILSHHIPLSREKIAIINADDAAGTKLQKISDQYNAGAVKVVIANKKAEVGVNLQKGTSAIHHLTLPWTPSSIKQRNGRGVRQGNTAANVKVYYYLGKGSFDFYRLDLLNRKSNWINDLLKGRSVEAANGNAMSQDDMLDMLAADPEEAKRRRMERLAKQKAERDARENQRMLNMLEQIANVSETLETLDETKEQRRKDLASKVEKLTKTINSLKEKGLELKPGDPDRAKLGERLIKEKDNLDKAQKALAGLDEAISNRRAELENVLKRNQAILQAKAKKGELPFDAELVDNPGSAMSLPNGKLLKVGQVYELIDADDSTSTIFKITEVNRKKKAVGIEGIIGHTYYLPTDYVSGMKGTVIRQERFPNATQVSYSEKELALKKVMSEQIMYSDLPKSGIEKQDFYSNVGQMRISGDCIVHDGTGGGYTLESSYDVEDKSRIVFPEPQNPDYRKRVAEMYLAFIRGGGYASYGLKLVMEMVFGSNWAAAASEYGAKATEAQVREFYTKTINDFLDDKLENGANETDPQKLYSVLRGASVYSLFESGKVRQIGDNVDFIMDIVKQCYDAQYEDIYKRAKSAEAQKEREAEMQAMAKVKEDPNYKEVPGELAAEFAKMGITVKINTEAVILEGRRVGRYKKYHDVTVSPFEYYFFQDKNAKHGVLFRVKDTLKSRYGAQFHSADRGVFEGAWWRIPTRYDLVEIFNVMQ